MSPKEVLQDITRTKKIPSWLDSILSPREKDLVNQVFVGGVSTYRYQQEKNFCHPYAYCVKSHVLKKIERYLMNAKTC